MIIQYLFDILSNGILWLLGGIPDVVITDTANWYTTFFDILNLATFVFPVADVLIMLGIWFSIYTLTIGWSAITKLWDMIPLKFS